MFGHIRQVARLATVSLLAASIIAPAASAGRYSLATPSRTPVGQQDTRPAATCHQYCGSIAQSGGSQAPATRSLVRTELVSTSSGFHWADAGVGLAVGCLGMVALLMFGTGLRTRVRHARAS